MKKIFLALCVCTGLCACSDDAIDGTGSSSSISFDGNDVYLTVRLNDVGSSTRATSPVDNPFTYGSEAEYAINDAYFYFFDEDGLFVSRAEVADFSEVGGTASEGTPAGNIEFKTNTVVVLKGLTDNKFPRYMVTVLNEPADFEGSYFTPATSLDEVQVKLANATDAIYTGNYFVMSTSAYNAPTYSGSYSTSGTGTDVSPWYFVTPINEDNFSLEPIDATGSTNAVDVYVERLAAKVELDVSNAMTPTAQTIEGDDGEEHTVYLLEETIAGTANQDDVTVTLPDGTTTVVEGTNHLYVEFLGWALNGTARNSNIVKDITGFSVEDQASIDGWYATDWNDSGNHRSYWGKSYNYGIQHEYPTSSIRTDQTVGNTDADEEVEGTWLDEYLKYTSLFDGTESDETVHSINQLGGYEYCAENTNTTDILVDKRSSGITNALIKAQIWTDDGDETTPTLVSGNIIRFEGELFTEAWFWQYIYGRVSADVDLFGNLYYAEMTGAPATLDENTGYTLAQLEDLGITDLISATNPESGWLILENEGNGSVYIELDEAAIDASLGAGGDYWFEASGVNEQGETLYYAINMLDETTRENFEEDIRLAIDGYNTQYEMIGYNNGLMYYSIPIEHLNNVTEDNPLPDDQNIIEAQYGIVRNHWYQLSITSLSNVGKGIWDEEEVIIPDPTDPLSYYVEASINLLSWKMVNQDVNL